MADASQRDHYDVLGLERAATAEDIKAAFRKLASQHHPDKNQGDPRATIRFKEINASYQVLSDPQRRSMYDRLGHSAENPGSPFSSSGPFAGGVIDMADLNVDGILGDLLGVFGVGRGERGDLKQDLEITFEEAAFGCEKEMTYSRVVTCTECRATGSAPGSVPQTCGACDGKGRVRFQQGLLPIAVERTCSRCKGSGRIVVDPCLTCRGTALVKSSNTLTVTLPAGVDAGATKLVPGAGNRPRADRAPGDLEITIRVKQHLFFRRKDDDVHCQVPITFAQATLGAEVLVPTLEGKGKLRVPPGTQPGTVLRIRGKGVPRKVGVGRGDQQVEVTVEVPTALTDRQRALMEELAKELGEDVQPIQKTFVEKLRDLFG
jgi:molecular chaperone DnaJ